MWFLEITKERHKWYKGILSDLRRRQSIIAKTGLPIYQNNFIYLPNLIRGCFNIEFKDFPELRLFGPVSKHPLKNFILCETILLFCIEMSKSDETTIERDISEKKAMDEHFKKFK